MNNAIKAILATGVLCSAFIGGESAAIPLVVPNAQAATEGNDDNFGPFFDSSVRYQQVYLGSEFGSGPLSITQVAFRPDGAVNVNMFIVPTSVRIDLSTTSSTPATLSTVFANNVGADNATVFDGFFFLNAPVTGPAGGPKDFIIVFDFATPFVYDPSLGNLLLDFRTAAAQVGISAPFDAQAGSPFTAHVDASGIGSTSGAVFADGLVTQFQVSEVRQVPEPSTLPLSALAMLVAVSALRRRSRRAGN